MVKAKVTRKSHSRREGGRLTTYQAGDEIQVSESELEAFGDRLERVSSPGRPKKKKAEPEQPEVSTSGETSGE